LLLILLLWQPWKTSPDELAEQNRQDSLRRADSTALVLKQHQKDSTAKAKADSIAYAQNAELQEKDNKAWNEAKRKNTKEAFEKYLADFPQGNHKADAETAIKDLNEKYGTFTDSRDGKTYRWVRIGSQIWMAENLAYKVGSGCWAYDNDQSNVAKYGYLYDWETAKTVAPAGWHLPSDSEWNTLINYLGGENVAGGKMKATSGWDSPNTGANNSSGFSAFPGGFYNYVVSEFSHRGTFAGFWSSTPYGSEFAWKRGLDYRFGEPYHDYDGRRAGFSVRCVKD